MKSPTRYFIAIVGIGLGLMMPLNMVFSDSQSLAIAAKSSCHTVVLEGHVTGEFPHFSGVLSGDLEGTIDVVLDDEETSIGDVIHGSGEETWVISGGTIPALVGRTLTSVFTFIQRYPPGQGAISFINGRYHVVDGAERGHLTFHATFDASVLPYTVDSKYRGVVCP